MATVGSSVRRCALLGAALSLIAAGTAPAADGAGSVIVMRLRVNAYGTGGSGRLVIDPATGAFIRRFSTGATSESEGWDGTRAWRADATGMPRVQSDPGEIHEIVGWSHAFSAAVRHGIVHATATSSQDDVSIAFSGHADRLGAYFIPSAISAHSSANGSWYAGVTSATLAREGASTFAPPAPPDDSSLSGPSTTVPLKVVTGTPWVDVRVNGTLLHMYLDTGGQNVLSASAARRVGLKVVGNATVSGGGGNATTRFAMAGRVQVGAATMSHQPYLVLSDAAIAPADGIIGYEMFARFVAKVDPVRRTLTLAKTAAAFGSIRDASTMGYIDRQPEVSGAIDRLTGRITLDTGSDFTAQVTASTVAAHGLVAALHAHVTAGGEGVGGKYSLYVVRAHSLVVGPAQIADPLLFLLMKPGVGNGPYAPMANAGFATIQRWIMVFDYAGSRIQFRPGGDTSGNVVHDRSGIVLGQRAGRLTAATVLGGTPAWHAGIRPGNIISSVDGRRVAAKDLPSVRRILRGAPGRTIEISADGRPSVPLVLRVYL